MTREELRERIADDLWIRRPIGAVAATGDQADYVISLMEQVRETCAVECENAHDGIKAAAIRAMPLPEPK